MSEGIYYLRLNGKVEGPFTIGQIYDLWAARKINSQTQFARFEEMDKWQPLSELTLKISAPRTNAPKSQGTEIPAPEAPARAKHSSTFNPEDFAAALLSKQAEQVARATPARPRSNPLSKFKSLNPTILSGALIALGVVFAAYFTMIFPLWSIPAKDALHDIAIQKQTGVLAGVGLMITGSLLFVGQQIARLRSSSQTDRAKSDSNMSPS
jgi:hypothetical protein